jgi:hypothetical protein
VQQGVRVREPGLWGHPVSKPFAEKGIDEGLVRDERPELPLAP